MIELDKKYQNALTGYTFVDLFAGIGGFRLALESFGAKCVFSSEWDKYAQEVYFKNFGERPKGDITKILEQDIPSHNILCAGFPCQAFSISGKQRGFEDTRGILFFDIARIAKHHQPEILLLENVSNFARHNKGYTLNTVLKVFDELGYNAFHKVLNASDFGVPQKRERIYFVCFLKTMNIDNFSFPSRIEKQSKLLDIVLDDRETKKFTIKRNDIKYNQKIKVDIDIFGNYPQRPIRIGIVNKGGQGERIYHECGHAITLSAYGGGVGAKTGLYMINGKLRKLAPRECARLMGFPDTFKIDENRYQSYKQFGNSVVVDVLQYILIKISERIKNG